jgi:sialate O-acetylesterase
MKRNYLCASLAAAVTLALPPFVAAAVAPASLFCDHAVLQQGMPVPVWGTADDGESVTVTIAGRSASTVAHQGHWSVRLPALPVGGPYELTIAGKNRVVLSDVLVGEVWICGGQSNMERQLGLREGQKPIRQWLAEAASANFPQIRHFGVAQKLSMQPETRVAGAWVVCTPETAPDFTAVGFFFGRALHQARGVPVGLIHSSWGGTPAESWMSPEGIAPFKEFEADLTWLHHYGSDVEAAKAAFAKTLATWFEANDPGANPAQPWSAAHVDTSGWPIMKLPTLWEAAGMPVFDGVVWFRREVEIPAGWEGKAVELHLGPVDDQDTTWVNGQQVGATDSWNALRVYRIEPGLLKPGRNTIAVRVLDTGGGGGLWGNGEPMRLQLADDPKATLSIEGDWRYHVAIDFSKQSRPPLNLAGNPTAPTVLYNAMIAPLQPYGIRGAIWYQGESNAGRAKQYRTLFPAMVADWRRGWGEGDFPFLYVQIAPYQDMNPEIREAQLLALDRIPNSAMVVTIDVGDANDIHPSDKRPVGERLALAARARAYHEAIEYSGPLFTTMAVTGNKAVLRFSHVGGGLVANGSTLTGFVVAGADGAFHPARAVIVGDVVEVSAPDVPAPVAVRYAWENVPVGNLFNRAGLPASPFRTDVD